MSVLGCSHYFICMLTGNKDQLRNFANMYRAFSFSDFTKVLLYWYTF